MNLKDISYLNMKIANDSITEVVDFLINNSKKSIKNETILISNRMKELKKRDAKGIISFENYTLEKNKIVSTLINIVNVAEEDIKKENQTKNKPNFKLGNSNVDLVSKIVDPRLLMHSINNTSFIQYRNDDLNNVDKVNVVGDFTKLMNKYRVEYKYNETEFNIDKEIDFLKKFTSLIEVMEKHNLHIFIKNKEVKNKWEKGNKILSTIKKSKALKLLPLLTPTITLSGVLTAGILSLLSELELSILMVEIIDGNNKKLVKKDKYFYYKIK